MIFYLSLYSVLSDLLINPLLNKAFSNFLGYRLYTVIEFVLLIYYFKLLFESKTVNRIISFLAVTFLAVSLVDLFVTQAHSFDSIPVALQGLIVITFCLFYLHKAIQELELISISASPNFWIITSLLIYFSGTFFLFALSQQNISDKNFSLTYSILIQTFTIIKNILISIGFYTFYRTQKINKSKSKAFIVPRPQSNPK